MAPNVARHDDLSKRSTECSLTPDRSAGTRRDAPTTFHPGSEVNCSAAAWPIRPDTPTTRTVLACTLPSLPGFDGEQPGLFRVPGTTVCLRREGGDHERTDRIRIRRRPLPGTGKG